MHHLLSMSDKAFVGVHCASTAHRTYMERSWMAVSTLIWPTEAGMPVWATCHILRERTGNNCKTATQMLRDTQQTAETCFRGWKAYAELPALTGLRPKPSMPLVGKEPPHYAFPPLLCDFFEPLLFFRCFFFFSVILSVFFFNGEEVAICRKERAGEVAKGCPWRAKGT